MKILFIVLLAFAGYEMITNFIVVPSKQTYKNIQNNILRKEGILEKLAKIFVFPLSKIISRFVKIDMYKRKKMVKNLARAGYTVTPEEYYANAVIISVYTILISVAFIILGISFIGFIGLFLAVVLYFSNIDKVNDKLKARNNAILRELPRFVRTYNHSKHANTQLLTVIEKYRLVAGEEFCYDLDVLITDLKTTSEEEALMNFDDRVNLPQLSGFVNALISSTKGVDQEIYFFTLEKEMNMLARENIRREMQKRPDKIKRVTLLTGIMCLVLYFYPVLITLLDNLATFK